jgi:hypothetical protein
LKKILRYVFASTENVADNPIVGHKEYFKSSEVISKFTLLAFNKNNYEASGL